jgi:hypothetical protein
VVLWIEELTAEAQRSLRGAKKERIFGFSEAGG